MSDAINPEEPHTRGVTFGVRGTAFGCLTVLPDPLPGEIADHLTSLHGTDPGRDIVQAAQAHMLAHVRGVFTEGIHFHEKTGG